MKDIYEEVEPSSLRIRFRTVNKFPNLEVIDLPEIQTKIWYLCNIYPTVTFGRCLKVGSYTEIGNNVWIGDEVTIGAQCFIPEGVIIYDKSWIGPGCKFSNDMYPPSPQEQWQITVIKKGARLGAGVLVRPGVTIGEGALIGVGAVVTKDIGDYEVWSGNPAKFMRSLRESEETIMDMSIRKYGIEGTKKIIKRFTDSSTAIEK
jgi:UDP-2-acetamido-3-amino-2,3-dideoxy-glucuronate N-acetyltransferase